MQKKRQNWKHIENSIKSSHKMDDDGISQIWDENAFDSCSQRVEEAAWTRP